MIKRRSDSQIEELHHFLHTSPGWMMRWGFFTIVCLLSFFLIGSFLYKYPEVIKANITIVTDNPPISLLAKANGKIDSILVRNGEKVNTDQVLLVIESPVEYSSLQKLKLNLKTLSIEIANRHATPAHLYAVKSLGSLQAGYSSLLAQYDLYLTFLGNSYPKQKVRSYKKQLALNEAFLFNSTKQNNILKSELSFIKKQLGRDSMLFKQQVISELDFENSTKIYLQKLYVLNAAETNKSNIRIKMEELNGIILNTEEEQKLRLEEIIRSLTKEIRDLTAQISLWEDIYVVKSPMNGYVSLNKFNRAGLNTSTGEPVINVIPTESMTMSIRAEAPMTNAGKLVQGLRVNIKLDNYPYLEYGFLKGHVSDISKIAENKVYHLDIKLDNGLETSLKKKLTFSQRMTGTADIITKDRRLIERITDPILSLFTN